MRSSSLARYWPELTEHLELSSPTLVALLARVGGPHDVAGAIEQSHKLLHGMSHGLMSEATIEGVLQSAASSAGVRLLTQEREGLMTLAVESTRAYLKGYGLNLKEKSSGKQKGRAVCRSTRASCLTFRGFGSRSRKPL